jgi:hypothetical protein
MSRSVKTNFWNLPRLSLLPRQDFFFLVEIFKIETFPVETRSCWDFCQDHRDCRDKSKQILTNQDKSRQILTNQDKYRQILTNQDKFLGIDELLDLNWDFWALTLISRQNQEVSISIEISWLLRQTFWKCQDVLDWRDNFLTMSRSRVSIEKWSRQIETPKPTNTSEFDRTFFKRTTYPEILTIFEIITKPM